MNSLIRAILFFGVTLCVLSSSLVSAQTLQRFFMSELQRSNLDRGIVVGQEVSAISNTTNSPQASTTASTINGYNEVIDITLTGLVLRQNMEHTIWLNGHAFTAEELPPRVTIDYNETRLIHNNIRDNSSQLIQMGDVFSISDQRYIQRYGDILRQEDKKITVAEEVNVSAGAMDQAEDLNE